jgi:MFS family permease
MQSAPASGRPDKERKMKHPDHAGESAAGYAVRPAPVGVVDVPVAAPVGGPVATPVPTPAASKALAALSFSVLLSSLATSIANVALPELASAFDASVQQVQWVVIAYLLAITTLVVGAGRLGDLLGRPPVLLVGIAIFTGASALCAIAPSLPWLIAARAAQGIGAAVMMALTLAFVGDVVPKERTGRAVGLLGTLSALGTALGPSFGGVLIAAAGWRAIFVALLALGLAALLLAHRYLPSHRAARPAAKAATPPGFDFAGTATLALTLAAYALAMTIGRGRFGMANVALLAGAALGAGLFVRIERRARAPLVRPAMFGDADLTASLLAGALVATVMMATLVVGPFHLVQSLGLDVASAGLAMSVGPLVAAALAAPAGRLADRFGARRTSRTGLVGMSVGAGLLALLPTRFGLAGYLTPLVVLTASYALFQTANNAAVMGAAAADQRGAVSGLLNLSRNLGLVTGASLMGAVFAAASVMPDVAPAAAVALGMRITFAVATGLILVALVVVGSTRPR